jgi:cell division protein FtsX
LRRFFASHPVLLALLGGILAVTIATLALGGVAGVLVAIASVLGLAWRFDNKSGAFFVLTLLVLLVTGILLLLMAMMAMMARN